MKSEQIFDVHKSIFLCYNYKSQIYELDMEQENAPF